MLRRSALALALLASGLITQASGQAPQPQAPTTVQLPTFRFFTINTTVSVPDRGGAYLGGVSRASDGGTTRGPRPMRSRAMGSGRGASLMSVHATVIDHAEIDRALLAEAAARRGAASADATIAKADFLSAHIGRAAATTATAKKPIHRPIALGGLAEIRQQTADQANEQNQKMAAWLAKAEALEAQGKPSVAKIYYQMIARRATGDLQATANVRIARIDAAGSSAKIARKSK